MLPLIVPSGATVTATGLPAGSRISTVAPGSVLPAIVAVPSALMVTVKSNAGAVVSTVITCTVVSATSTLPAASRASARIAISPSAVTAIVAVMKPASISACVTVYGVPLTVISLPTTASEPNATCASNTPSVPNSSALIMPSPFTSSGIVIAPIKSEAVGLKMKPSVPSNTSPTPAFPATSL